MEMQERRRVVLRTDGKRRHLELVSGTLKGSETINSTGHSLGINPAGDHHSTSLTNHDIKYHSTPLHLPPLTKFNRRKRKNKMKRNRIHPKSYDEAMSSSNTSSLPIPSTDITYSQLSTDTTTLSCSLPSLLTSQHRKGGSRASINTDWSSNGGAELERCLPQRQLSVFIGTWNMAKLNSLPDSLDQFLLPSSQDIVSELYVVGTQESTSQQKEWEILLQQTLGPTHLLIHSGSLGEIYLLIFLRRDLLWYCSVVQSMGYSTRPGSIVKTKGGLGVSFSLFGSEFLFITSHFTAHQDRVGDRNLDMQRIATNITTHELSDFDYVFWFGDLNYRVDMERSTVDQYIQQWQHHQQDGWLPLLLNDQLTKEMLQGHVFQGFSEQPIKFPPTYKFDINSDIYDSSEKQRVPSWTDRILFQSQTGSGISGSDYNSCQSLKCSDHRAVYGVFNVRLEPSTTIDGVPELMADFNREVYRIAYQRRTEMANMSLKDKPPPNRTSNNRVTTTVCSIL